MKKKNFIIFILLVFNYTVFAQLKDVNEKKEMMGIRLLRAPDYSKLKAFRVADNGKFNLYKVTTNNIFSGNGYTFPEAYVMIEKGIVSRIICMLDKPENKINLLTDLRTLRSENIRETMKNCLFRGDSIFYDVSTKFLDRDCMWIDFESSLPFLDVKDNSAIVALLGKHYSDNAVQQFINSIPGKYDKKKFKDISYSLIWKKNGVSLDFMGKGDTALIWNINFFLDLDLYAKEEIEISNGYTGLLPYGITASDNPFLLIDKFGAPKNYKDPESSLCTHIKFPDFFIDADYKYDKIIENRKLSHLQIRKI